MYNALRTFPRNGEKASIIACLQEEQPIVQGIWSYNVGLLIYYRGLKGIG